jgi:hypothetical protein
MKEPKQANNETQIAEMLVENLKQANANKNVDEVVMALKLINSFLGQNSKEEELKKQEQKEST